METITTKEKLKKINYRKLNIEELLNNKYIKIHMLEDKIDIYNEIARTMANKLSENNKKGLKTSFILPVGPRGQYTRFAHICNSEKISCKNLITINMDEFLDANDCLIPKDHPLSFRGFMDKNLFSLLDDKLMLKPSNIYFPNPKKLTQIEDLLKDIGGADICFGGIGINGHLAFNEPIRKDDGKFMELKTRILNVAKETIVMTSLKCGGNMGLVPKRCITLGMAEIFESRELKFYLEHNHQYTTLIRSIYEKPNSNFPATFIKEHRNSSITVSRNILSIDLINADIQCL